MKMEETTTHIHTFDLEAEKKTVEFMIRLYCRKKEGNKQLCTSCQELIVYAHQRVNACKVKQDGTTCDTCKVHCYKLAMRERIKAVMRFSGPRMFLYHPLVALKHVMRGLKKKFLS